MLCRGSELVRKAKELFCALFVVLIVILLPKIFFIPLDSALCDIRSQNYSSFRLGIENISDEFLRRLSSTYDYSYKVGLITNQSGCDQSGQRTVDILLKRGVRIATIFAPEHGINGVIPAEKKVSDTTDINTNIPVISLYNNTKVQKIREKALRDLDVLFYDIQDSGVRHYTYITTLFKAIKIASEHNKPIVVFDRPNLLGGLMEGPLVEQKYLSDMAYISIPIRYGMTVGELAHYFNTSVIEKPAKLHIVPMKHYHRYQFQPKHLLRQLSPNIPTLESCYGYSFLGVLGEVRPFYLGVGTPQPFQTILLPDSVKLSRNHWFLLHKKLKDLGVETSFYRYCTPRKRKYYSGLRFKVENIAQISSFRVCLTILDFFKQHDIDLRFSSSFDWAMGTESVKQFVYGKISQSTLQDTVNKQLNQFYEKAKPSFMYAPFPRVVNL